MKHLWNRLVCAIRGHMIEIYPVWHMYEKDATITACARCDKVFNYSWKPKEPTP